MMKRNLERDIEWLIHDFEGDQMPKKDLREKSLPPTAGTLLFSYISGVGLHPSLDPCVEKADLSMIRNLMKEDVPLAPGSIVAVSLAFCFEHTGIYMGNGKFLELYGDGSINMVGKKDFLDGAYRNNDFPVRTGIHVYVASQGDQPIVVKEAVEQGTTLYKKVKKIPYHVLHNNCHMFTGFCLFGRDFQRNYGCRFFTNLTRMIITELAPSVDSFSWRISDCHYGE